MFSKNGELIWDYVNKAEDDKLRSLGWSSYYNHYEIKNFLKILSSTKCKN